MLRLCPHAETKRRSQRWLLRVNGSGRDPLVDWEIALVNRVSTQEGSHFLLRALLGVAVALLDEPCQFLGAAFGPDQLIVGEFAPLHFGRAFPLMPCALHLLFVHGTSSYGPLDWSARIHYLALGPILSSSMTRVTPSVCLASVVALVRPASDITLPLSVT